MTRSKATNVIITALAIIALVGALYTIITDGRASKTEPQIDAEKTQTREIDPSTSNYGYSINTVKKSANGEIESVPIDPNSEAYRATIRKEYVNSEDLPDGVSFRLTIASVANRAERNLDDAADRVMQMMDVDLLSAETLVARISRLHEEYQRETATMMDDLLCFAGVPKVYGDDVYEVFEKSHDVRDALAEDYFLKFISDLPGPQSDSFWSWNNEGKFATTSVRYKYKEHYEFMGGNANSKAAEICSIYSYKKR